MRQEATELKVGKWYADNKRIKDVIFLRFHSFSIGMPNFDLSSSNSYVRDQYNLIGFIGVSGFYEVTEEEILKYNLV